MKTFSEVKAEYPDPCKMPRDKAARDCEGIYCVGGAVSLSLLGREGTGFPTLRHLADCIVTINPRLNAKTAVDLAYDIIVFSENSRFEEAWREVATVLER